MIKLLIFDLDGTLIDSLTDITQAVNLLMKQEGQNEYTEKQIAGHIGEGLRKLLGEVFPFYRPNNPEYARIDRDFMRFYEQECTRRLKWMKGALEFLNDWKGQKALVTNKNWSPTEKILRYLGVQTSEWCYLAGSDSGPFRKPHPGPLLEALHRAQANPREALMIGDGKPDILAATAAGVWSAAVTFGYTETQSLAALAPDAILNSYSDLKNTIAHLNQISSTARLSS